MAQPSLASLAKGPAQEALGYDEASRAAITSILTHHNRRLFRLARGIVGNSGEAEDVVQDAYVHALANLTQLRDQAKVGAWLSRITVNEALARLRRRREDLPLEAGTEHASEEAVGSTVIFGSFGAQDPEKEAVQNEVRGLLERAIDTLPLHFRTVFVACDVEGLSAAEAAAALGLYQVTVKTRLFRARRLLRRKLDASLIAALAAAFPCAGERCERITTAVLARLHGRMPRLATSPLLHRG